jgi:hypothetical protein
LKSNEIIYGKNHLNTATTYHSIAIAYSELGKFKEALSFEKKNNSILSESFGEADARTKDSNALLNQLTSRAVQKQKEIKLADLVCFISSTSRDSFIQILSFQLPKRPQKGGPTTSSDYGSIGSMPLSDVCDNMLM